MLAFLQGTATGQLYAFSIANNMWTVMELGGILYVMATAIDYPQVKGAPCRVCFNLSMGDSPCACVGVRPLYSFLLKITSYPDGCSFLLPFLLLDPRQ